MNQYLITALIDIAVALFAFNKKGNLAARALSYTALSIGVWSIELYLLTTIVEADALQLWFHITRWGMFLIPPCFALLAWRLVGARSNVFYKVVVVPGFVFAVTLCVANFFFFPSRLQVSSTGYMPEVDGIYHAFIVMFLWCFVGSIFHTAACYHSVTQREKQRAKWVLITLLFSFSGGVFNLFLMPHDIYFSKYVASILNVVFVALLFYSTVQHHLMDFRLALSVGLTKGLLLGFFIWFLYIYVSLAESFDHKSASVVALACLMIVMMEVYPRLLKWILPNAKKLIVKGAYDYNEVVEDASRALHDCVGLEMLFKVCDHLFYQVVGVSRYSLIVYGKNDPLSPLSENEKLVFDKYCKSMQGVVFSDETDGELRSILKQYNADICFCLEHGGVCLGLIFVGPVREQGYYRYDDVRTFEWLRVELGQVLNRINQLDEMQNQLGQAKKTLSMLGVMNHYHHDIKAPLAIIDGVLSNDIYDKEKQKDIVLQQVERGSQLITTMASLLKGERKRKIQALSLKEVVRDSVFLFSQGIDEVNYLFGDAPEIRGDAEDLKILVINIVKNAIEARQDNQQLVVTISTWQTDSHVCLSFADTGIGMPVSRVDTLWEDATSSKSSGNGIGMQAIKRIADEHFAVIEVNSEVGRGSEFVFKFPTSVVVTEPNEKEGSREDIAESPFSNSTKAKKPLAG